MKSERRERKRAVTVVTLSLALFAGCGEQPHEDGVAPGTTASPAAAAAIASDSTGQRLVVVGDGVWTSINGGKTWIDRTSSAPALIQQWTSVASDSTGMNLVAVVNGFYDGPSAKPAEFSGDVWTSADGGATWVDQTASSPAHGQAWRSVASDASGTKLVAVTAGLGAFGAGAIWTSADGGATWTNRTGADAAMGSQSWSSVASDATGQNLVAAGGGSGVWASMDGGATWTDRTPADPKFQASFGDQVQGWSSVASDATGTKLIAAVDSGDLWISTDGGVTWTDTGPASSWQDWLSVASDSTGTNLIAVDGLVNGYNGDVWRSKNGGLSWTNQATEDAGAGGPWRAVASSAAGDHVVAIGPGAIWRQ